MNFSYKTHRKEDRRTLESVAQAIGLWLQSYLNPLSTCNGQREITDDPHPTKTKSSEYDRCSILMCELNPFYAGNNFFAPYNLTLAEVAPIPTPRLRSLPFTRISIVTVTFSLSFALIQ